MSETHEKSKSGALEILKRYPEAKIFSRTIGNEHYNQKWTTAKGLTAKKIKSLKSDRVFSVTFDSVPFCVLDYDLLSDNHKVGLTKSELKKALKEWSDLRPCYNKSPNGGYHIYFLIPDEIRKGGPREDTGIKGLELKSHGILKIHDNPFKKGTKLVPLPDKIVQAWKSARGVSRGYIPDEELFGPGKNNSAIPIAGNKIIISFNPQGLNTTVMSS